MTNAASGAMRAALIAVIALVGTDVVSGVVETTNALLRGTAPEIASFRFGGPAQLVQLVLSTLMLSLEVVLAGWQRSTARRLVNGSGSSRFDLWCWLMTMTDLTIHAIAIATLGVFTGFFILLQGTRVVELEQLLPFWVELPAAILLVSFLSYWTHRLLHTRYFWRLHTLHHSVEELNIAATYRDHPLEVAIRLTMQTAIPSILGFSSMAILLGVTILSAVALWQHSNIPTSDFLEGWVCLGPRGHRVHHAIDADLYQGNFGSLVLWDRLFGTYIVAPTGFIQVGLTGADAAHLSHHPLVAMVKLQIDWLAELMEGGCRLLTGIALRLSKNPEFPASAERTASNPRGRMVFVAKPAHDGIPE